MEKPDMRVAKWGNSLAVRLPVEVVEALELKEGSEISIHVAGHHAFEVGLDRSRQEAIERLRKFRGRLPAGFTFNREEANAR
jgi:antitoxin MazE